MLQGITRSRWASCVLGATCLGLAFLPAADPMAAGLKPDGTKPVCGDANADHRLDISDAIRVLSHIFQGAAPPACSDAPPPPCDGASKLDSWIAQKGIPTLALTSSSCTGTASARR
jgi:hypothetical protein